MLSSRPVFMSHHSRDDAEDSPTSKRQCQWQEDAHNYYTGSFLTDTDVECITCKQLRYDCAMLESSCPCKAVVCFDCYGRLVNQSLVRAEDCGRAPATPQFDKPWFQSAFSHLPDVPVVMELLRCPKCRSPNVEFKPLEGKIWTTFRKMYKSVTQTLEESSLLKVADRMVITCAVPGHAHETDKEWLECPLSSFTLECPATACLSLLEIHGRSSATKQVMAHFVSRDCAGVVDCPHCYGDGCRSTAGDGKAWHYDVAIRNAALHIQLHRKLEGLYRTFREKTPGQSSASHIKSWWECAVSIFKGIDPRDAESVDVCALSRVVNGVQYDRKWAEPWMVEFMSWMNSNHDSNTLHIVSFPYFFNAGYPDPD
jgi:hypothetical protein